MQTIKYPLRWKTPSLDLQTKAELAVELSNQILDANRELATVLNNPSTRNPAARIEAIRSLQLRIDNLHKRLAAV